MLRNTNRKKGISPLVASVLLIAFTMSVAVLLTAWVTNFTQTQKENANKYEEELACSYQNIEAQPSFTRYNSTYMIFETYITSSGLDAAEIDKVAISYDGVTYETPKYLSTPQRIEKNEGISIKLNLTNALVSGPDFKKIRFYTSCGSNYYTTLVRPSGGWSPLTNIGGTLIDLS